ncbi:MAG TPA: deoxyguanosinetriphosphate triphosphohydrolase [Gammaproteobacteria bacterium]|nr:deoxyguanosinetriphosphate triphosphohydrolase [Gammaproteobacteria bacterium]
MTELAGYAATDKHSRGRRYQEPPPANRSEYQRDRDRIIHSAAFRRLEYKTQVFVNHEGDLYRTRLTHSIEVAQIARSIARALRLNEDLTEAIALAHDLGHTPFGHAGQDALNNKMRMFNGFEHNLQSLRVVDELEERYAEFQGLNLTFESREGILKHCSIPHARKLGEVGERFLRHSQPSLEAQLTNLADEIAYNSHDVDDGLRSGLITIKQLRGVELFSNPYNEVKNSYPELNERRTIYEVVRRIINLQVSDLIRNTEELLLSEQPGNIDDIRAAGKPLIIFSDEMRSRNRELKHFLRTNLYQHYRVHRMSTKAVTIIHELFDAFMNDTRLLPPDTAIKAGALEQDKRQCGQARAIADYIAGMTDRYAIREYQRICQPLGPT